MSSMTNRYFVLRHGKSLANKENIIASSLESGLHRYGLTPEGREQVNRSVLELKAKIRLSPHAVILSSPLLRTLQSAQVASKILNIPFQTDQRLIERNFGGFDLTRASNYRRVWQEDAIDSNHAKWEVESPNAVFARVQDLLGHLEKTICGETFLFCTHGDVASILMCGLCKMKLTRHRQFAFHTGELREVTECNPETRNVNHYL